MAERCNTTHDDHTGQSFAIRARSSRLSRNIEFWWASAGDEVNKQCKEGTKKAGDEVAAAPSYSLNRSRRSARRSVRGMLFLRSSEQYI
jgi:hypothetical protein